MSRAEHDLNGTTTRLRVLAITKEPVLTEGIRRALAHVSCDIAADLGPREALADAVGADIAVVDEVQGDQSGFRLAKALRRVEPRLRLIVVLRRGSTRRAERRAVDLSQGPLQADVGLAALLRRAVDKATPRRRANEGSGRYSLAIEATHDGLWDWDLGTNSMSFSPRWRRLLGLATEAVGNSPDEWFGRVHPEDVGRLRDELTLLLRGEAESVEFECRMRHRDGTSRSMLVRALAVRDSERRVHRMAGSHTDTTSQKAEATRLQQGALHDPLTRLANRELFHERLHLAFARAATDPAWRFGVLFVDIDRFKHINDSLGHEAGDEVLLSVAARLRQCVRATDTLARLGGDEFAVLTEGVQDLAQVVALAHRILDVLAGTFHVSGHDVVATASIGIALRSAEHAAAKDVLHEADVAMYRAKAQGRARYEIGLEVPLASVPRP